MARVISVRAWGMGLAMAASASAGAIGEDHRPAGRADEPTRRDRILVMSFDNVRLADALAFWSRESGIAVEPLWIDDRYRDGLDPERRVSIKVEGAVVDGLEAVLSGVDDGEDGGVTWQRTARGAIQVGPRSRLNAYRRLEVYDIADLLRETPHFREGPAIDLDAALARPPGGSIFRGDSDESRVRERDDDERAEELIELIVETVEPEQWVLRGGSSATIRFYGSTLVVNAPGYVHRGLNAAAR